MSKEQATKGKKAVTKRKRPEVQVVACGTSFPISTKTTARAKAAAAKEKKAADDAYWLEKKRKKGLLDWNDTAKEVKSLGATAFVGKQKRNYQAENYKFLTGGDKKKQSVPLPIVRGIKKKAAQRLARELKEAKEAGMVLPKSNKKRHKDKDSSSRIHGPAPTIGFMKKGVFSVKGKST